MKMTCLFSKLFCLSAAFLAFRAAAAPVITAPLQSVSQINGFPAWFSVTATGAPSLTFQWRRGGTNQVGASSNVFGWPAVQDRKSVV